MEKKIIILLMCLFKKKIEIVISFCKNKFPYKIGKSGRSISINILLREKPITWRKTCKVYI